MGDAFADGENDNDSSGDTEAYTDNTSGAPATNILAIDRLLGSWVEKVISVEALGGVSDICESKVAT